MTQETEWLVHWSPWSVVWVWASVSFWENQILSFPISSVQDREMCRMHRVKYMNECDSYCFKSSVKLTKCYTNVTPFITEPLWSRLNFLSAGLITRSWGFTGRTTFCTNNHITRWWILQPARLAFVLTFLYSYWMEHAMIAVAVMFSLDISGIKKSLQHTL